MPFTETVNWSTSFLMYTPLPSYRHIVNPRLKHTYLSFDDQGELLIRSPRVSNRYIETLLLKKAAWIKRAREAYLSKKGRIDTIQENGFFYFIGTPYQIAFEKSDRRVAIFELADTDTFIFSYTHFDSEVCRKKIEAHYRKEAEKMIVPMVNRWAKKMRLAPEAIRFRKTKRQWGSCSSKNVLSFNTMLMKLPLEAIEYVVIHELVHIAHKHHQKAFWELVERYLPDYCDRQAILREYTPA